MSSGLERLVEDIIKESKAKAEEAKTHGHIQVEQTIETARTEAVREGERIIRDAKTEVGATRSRLASQSRQRARIAYLTRKNAVIQDLLKDVQTRLTQLVENESIYRPFLVKAITRGIETVPAETLEVCLCKRDIKRYKGGKLIDDARKQAQTRKNVRLSRKPVETIGGAVVTSEDGKMRADCTLEARLWLMEPEILAEISKMIFPS